MVPPQPLSKQLAWLEIKQGIVSGRFKLPHVEQLLNALNPNDHNVSFKKLGAALIKTVNGSGKSLMVPGFEMQTSLPPNVALLLSRALQLKGTFLQFKVESAFKRGSDGNILFTVRTSDPEPESPDDIRNIRHLMDADVERFARYSLLRGVAQALSLAGVFKPSPDIKTTQRTTNYPANPKAFWEASGGIYLQESAAITNILNKSLSKTDVDKINELFELSTQIPKKLPQPQPQLTVATPNKASYSSSLTPRYA